MAHPGDQGRPGGPRPSQPPQEPYGPGAGAAPPYGRDNDDAPFAYRDEGPGAMPSGGAAPGGPAGRAADRGDRPVAGAAYGSPPPEGPGAGRFGDGRPGEARYDDGRYRDDRYDDDRYGGEPYGGDQPGGHYGRPEETPPGPPGADRPGRRRTPLVIAAAAVAGLALIGGGIGLSSMLKGDEKETDAASSQAAASPTPSPTQPVLAPPVKLKSRATDPAPLTLGEVFGRGKFKAHGLGYVRTAVSAKKDCTSVVGGRTLEKTLKQGRCTQALRATYALTNGKLIGTVGVFNLEHEDAAKKAVKAAAAKDAFLQALPGKGVSRTNGRGEALGTSQARGHYLLMTWVQRPDGKQIPKKHHAAVRVFGAEMVKGSNLALALHYRETEGKPLQR
ncbi:MAG TPA: hypothetical protein VIL71_20310 [Spirillospora sp.]